MPRTLRERRPASPGRAQTPPVGDLRGALGNGHDLMAQEEWERSAEQPAEGRARETAQGWKSQGRVGMTGRPDSPPGNGGGGWEAGHQVLNGLQTVSGNLDSTQRVFVCVAGVEGRNLKRETKAEVMVATTQTKRRGRREEQ